MSPSRTIAASLFALALAGLLLAPLGAATQHGAAQAPATVYEAPEMSPQNMDYDAEDKMFIAHSGWLNDKLVHYYKFRMYTPGTYPTKVPMGGAPQFPVAPLYVVSTDGTFGGIVEGQKPILRYHTADGEDYSDFVQLVWVQAGAGFVADSLRSYDDIVAAGLTMEPSGIVVNMPLVPTGSRLQAPGGGVAPILPVMAWYEDAEVQTFVFEATSRDFADHYNPLTREGSAAEEGSGFEITVSPFATAQRVNFAPILHVNQYFTGVTPGVNSGGPAHMGQRNVIGVDRLDPGYSPLWQVIWVTKLPVGYQADQASNLAQFTEENGFGMMVTPMFVNCPNIGAHGGGAANANKAASFQPEPEVQGPVTLEGALVMEGGQPVTAKLGGRVVAQGTTGMMGAWSLDIPATALSSGTNTVTVEGPAGPAATYTLQKASTGGTSPPPTTPPSSPPTPGGGESDQGSRSSPVPAGIALVALGAGAAVLAARRRQG